MKRRGMAMVCALLCMGIAGVAGEGRFFSRLHGGGYLAFFANQQDAFDEERYVSEGGLEADIFLVRLSPRTHLVWRIACMTGMGEATTSGLPFAVQEVRYALIPFIEYENRLLLRAGLDHGCDHLILKDTEDPWYVRDGRQVLRDVYDNRLFVGVGSTVYRRAAWREMEQDTAREAPDWVHYAEAGYYLQELFGWVDEEALNEGNNWWWDLVYDLRARLWSGTAGDLFALNRLQVLLDRDEDIYWRDSIGVEYQPRGAAVGTAWTLSWHAIDEHVRDAGEGLVALSGRFFF